MKKNNQEAFNHALETLKYYADKSNWGTTSSYGHEKSNRWLGEGEGAELALYALKKIELILSED
ncbi:MAG: hypothetical protein AAFW70_01095 [Cyanobacteria bacterium J06635_10]